MAEATQTIERPPEQTGAARWLRKNLFSTWYNALLTLLALALISMLLRALLSWLFTQADWRVVTVNLRLLLIGTFPIDQLWRVWLCVAITSVLLGLSWAIWPRIARDVAVVYGSGLCFLALLPFSIATRLALALCGGLIVAGMILGMKRPNLGRWTALGWILVLPLAIVLLRGTGLVLPIIQTNQWGGLLLTMILAITGIVLSFPLGVLLAIGRRSTLPAFRIICSLYIELIRGVPLITVLFMSQIMLPLFVPGGESIDSVVRVIIGFTLFTAAYIAENVRGGLQAIPRGQDEAAQALGLNPFLTMILIVLPQALRIVIPANVGQFISLFKDTSLVAVAGLLDLLGIGRSVLAQPAFLGRQMEILLFIAAVYWIFAYSLTYASRRLEAVLGVGRR